MKRRPVRATTIREALADPQLLGRALKGDSWRAWRVLLIASMGEALTESERLQFRELTGRDAEPLARIDELVAVVGRRGGKSRALAILAVFLAILVDHSGVLAPGERGIVLCIAPDQKQAKLALDYAEAAIAQSPILRQLIAGRTADALELKNGISIEVRSASFRRLRGPTYIPRLARCRRGMENAAAGVVRSQNPIRHHVRRKVRHGMMVNPASHTKFQTVPR